MKSGILLLDKPAGLSSNAVLQRVKRMLQAERAGHVGSLDPLATGMLPICLGEATKIAGEILAGRKSYRFTVRLGTRTTTGDTEGVVAETAPVPAIEATLLDEVLNRFRGRQSQVPPMFSALKREGQPLYKLARAGIEVERAARAIEIFELRRLAYGDAVLELEVLCSKGTYVRALAEDIAVALGTLGHVTALRRLYVEPFEDRPMETLQSIARTCESGTAPPMLAADVPLQHLPAVRFDAQATMKLRHGQPVPIDERNWLGLVSDGNTVGGVPPIAAAGTSIRVRLYDASSVFIGLGESDGQGTVRPRRLFV